MFLRDLSAQASAAQHGDQRALAILARTERHRGLVRDAEASISALFEHCSRCYVALSGGKDSAVVLAMAAPIARALGIPVVASWSDDELEYDEQHDYIPRLCAAIDVELFHWCSHATHAKWFTSWLDTPYFREPPLDRRNEPGPANHGGRAGMRALGFEGCLLGLRAQESSYRRINAYLRGRVYCAEDRGWRAQPLVDWRVEDVWAYLLDRAIPTNPVYRRLAAIGVPLHEQRVGPLPLSDARVLEYGWPSLYRRLLQRYGDRW